MMVWWMRTKSTTLPSEYLVFSSLIAASTASLMAMPSDPAESGSLASIAFPASVSSLGLGVTSAPQTCIMERR